MKRQHRLARVLLRLAGLILFLFGLSSGYWWFYKFGPVRHTLDPQWVSRHSQQDYWQEVQKRIHRGNWLHDDGFAVGRFGDKSWAQWIMNHVAPGTSMGCLGGHPQHSATAMQFITNQDVGEDADAWLDWWEMNQSKSQEEWIADGFAQRGLKIDVPPMPDQTRHASHVAGRLANGRIRRHPGTNEVQRLSLSARLRLRPCSVCLVRPLGLRQRRAWSARVRQVAAPLAGSPWRRNAPIRKQGRGLGGLSPACNLRAGVQIAAYVLIFAPATLGTVLVLWSFRRREQPVGQAPRA